MKYKTKIISLLVLLFGLVCFAFYDTNLKGNEDIVLINEIFSNKKIGNNKVSTENVSEEIIDIKLDEKEDNDEDEVVDTSNLINQEQEPASAVVPISYVNYDLGQQIVNYALNFVGNPYVYGGNSLTNGTDCSGFTKLVYGHFGINLPRVAYDQQTSGYHVSLSEIAPGDIVLSGYNGTIGHASIYIGNNQLVHALNSNVGIVVTDLYIMPILEVRRVI